MHSDTDTRTHSLTQFAKRCCWTCLLNLSNYDRSLSWHHFFFFNNYFVLLLYFCVCSFRWTYHERGIVHSSDAVLSSPKEPDNMPFTAEFTHCLAFTGHWTVGHVSVLPLSISLSSKYQSFATMLMFLNHVYLNC